MTPLPGQLPALAPEGPWGRRARIALGVARFLVTLYAFLLSITLVGSAFLAFGEGFAAGLIRNTKNPFVGLFIGILATSIIQSSSATTSIVVGTVVAVGPERLHQFLPNAIPIIMGANIGTTVTAVLVSMGHIRRKEEFRRAFGGALVHEIFKLICVMVMFPLELATGFLQHSACALAGCLWSSAGKEGGAYAFGSPLKAILKPVAKALAGLFIDPDPGEVSTLGVTALLVIALAMLFGSLWLITKMMRRAVVGRAEALIDRTIGRAPFLGLMVGFVLTAIVQSSSAVTSILVPLAGAGVLTLAQIFPIELGSCLGTTVTGVLAALAVGPAGLAVALTHVIFNLTGIALIYPIPWVRAQPVRLAKWFAGIAAESKRYAVA
ncbi:MAG: Na/Pi symporter, partial [Planctomycetota bacterium]